MPFYVSGVRLQRGLGPRRTVEVGLYSGLGRVVTASAPSTLIARIFGQTEGGAQWQALIGTGPTRPALEAAGGGQVRAWLIDAFASAPVASAFELALQLNAGVESWSMGGEDRLARWAAGDLWARLRLGQAWRLGARAGLFWQGGDRDVGALGGVAYDLGRLWWPTSRLAEGALALEWRPAPALMLRLEGRVDHAAEAIFASAEGAPRRLRPTLTAGLCWTL
jgi:hypothetical protein